MIGKDSPKGSITRQLPDDELKKIGEDIARDVAPENTGAQQQPTILEQTLARFQVLLTETQKKDEPETFGIPDSEFLKQINETLLIPEGVFAAGGNEDREVGGQFGNTTFYALTDRGISPYDRESPKEQNDDGYLVMPGRKRVGIFDGVGGRSCQLGYAATNVAITSAIYETTESMRVDESLLKMHGDVHHFKNNHIGDEELKKVCTAGVLAEFLTEYLIALAHLGDSRAMLCRNGLCVKVTEDDNNLTQLAKQLGVSKQEIIAMFGLQASRDLSKGLTQCIGGKFNRNNPRNPTTVMDPHFEVWHARPGDLLTLYTDGLSANFEEDEIAGILNEILQRTGSLEEAAKGLKKRTIDKMKTVEGHGDNLTIVLIPIV